MRSVSQKVLPKSEFGRNVLTLVTGTAIAQAVPVAVSPILTRVYTPEEFGILALYMAMASLLSVIVTLRYELAIVQPVDDEDAAAILVLCFTVTSVLSLVVLVLVYIFNEDISALLENREIGKWLYLLPASTMLNGVYQSLSYWNTRSKRYGEVARSKIGQGVATGGSQVALGYCQVGGGLIVGMLMGQIVAVWLLFITIMHSCKLRPNGSKLLHNAKRYKNFPKYSTIGALADGASLQMPVFMLSRFFDASVTGIFSLTFRVLNLPMSLLSRSLSQVLFQKVTSIHNDKAADVRRLVIKLFFLLLAMMVPYVVAIWMFGESLFVFVFGEPWRQAGSMASAIVVAVAIRFAVSPLSSVLALDHNVKIGVQWQLTYLVTVTFTLYYFSGGGIQVFLLAFVVHEVILYLFYLTLILRAAN